MFDQHIPDDGRHSDASTMIAAGVDPGEGMRRMGHSTIAMTLDRNTRGIKGNESDTAEKLQAFIDPSRGTVVGQSSVAGSGSERSERCGFDREAQCLRAERP